MKSLSLYLSISLFIIGADLRYVPVSLSHIGFLYISLLFVLSGCAKIPALLVKAIFLSIGIIGYAIFVDLAQFEFASYDFRHLANISIVVSSLFVGYTANTIWRREGINAIASKMIKLYVLVVWINAIVVSLQVIIPEVRSLIEGVIAESSRTDYLNGIRYRGLASAGGATLSIATAFSTLIAIHLAKQNEINWTFAITAAITNTFAMIFIGRTGFLVLILYVFYEMISNLRIKRLGIIVFSLTVVVFTFSSLVELAVEDGMVSVENYRHAFGIFLKMSEYGFFDSVENEGTVPYVQTFYELPDNVWKLIFGIGNYSGGYRENLPGDPGIMKLLTLIGLPATISLYLVVAKITFKVANASVSHKSVIIFIGLTLILLEVKEPFLFKGSGAKLFWILMGVYLMKWKVSSYCCFNLTQLKSCQLSQSFKGRSAKPAAVTVARGTDEGRCRA